MSEALYATVPIHKRLGVVDAVSTRRAASVLNFGVDDAWKCHDDLEFGDQTFDLREQLLITHCCWDSQLVHGHVLISDRIRAHCQQRYKFLTIMREPIARTISNYRMAVKAGIASPDADEWLESPIARSHSTTFLRYLSGKNSVDPKQEAASLEQALSTLDMFSLIGFLDDTPTFAREFEQMFNTSLRLKKYNTAQGPEVQLSASQLAKLRDMCAPDLAIYERARDMKGNARAQG
ncbi:MAG: hypothetical protein KUG69_04585 [Marinosulfonomonas sp.]|nr:hypothetical protein [Marinosulfonomonas sp.]